MNSTSDLEPQSARALKPYPAYKDSGVEWLRAPAHWRIRRFESLVKRIDQGVSPQAENYTAESGSWGVLKAGCVNRGEFRDSEPKRLPSDFVFDPALTVHLGDVLVSRASGSAHLVGSVGRVSALKYRLILSDKAFRPVFSEEVDVRAGLRAGERAVSSARVRRPTPSLICRTRR